MNSLKSFVGFFFKKKRRLHLGFTEHFSHDELHKKKMQEGSKLQKKLKRHAKWKTL